MRRLAAGSGTRQGQGEQTGMSWFFYIFAFGMVLALGIATGKDVYRYKRLRRGKIAFGEWGKALFVILYGALVSWFAIEQDFNVLGWKAILMGLDFSASIYVLCLLVSVLLRRNFKRYAPGGKALKKLRFSERTPLGEKTREFIRFFEYHKDKILAMRDIDGGIEVTCEKYDPTKWQDAGAATYRFFESDDDVYAWTDKELEAIKKIRKDTGRLLRMEESGHGRCRTTRPTVVRLGEEEENDTRTKP